MKKFLLIFFILAGLLCSVRLSAQSGGRKREKKAKTKGSFTLKRNKSQGNADAFARGNSGRRGKLARLFTKTRASWVYKRSGSVRNQNKANRYLFKRSRSEGVIENAETQKIQNTRRSRKRDHGNDTFKRKKY